MQKYHKEKKNYFLFYGNIDFFLFCAILFLLKFMALCRKKSKDPFVKCPKDGELPSERKADCLRFGSCIPLHKTKEMLYRLLYCFGNEDKGGAFYMKKERLRSEKESFLLRVKQDFFFFKNIRLICFCAILAAMSLILGKFLQIPNPFQEFIRISFENTPVILAGIVMGPFAGAFVGVVADLVGCVLYGYAINPLVTLGAAAVGLFAGIAAYLLRKPRILQIIAAVILSHAVGSVFIKSLGLAAWYAASYDMGFWTFVGWRLVTYLLIAAVECLVLNTLLSHRAVSSQLERMCKQK